MRFMVLVKASRDSEAGVMPDERLIVEMGKFNEQLIKAGVMLAGDGLHPSSKGARIRFSADADVRPTVSYGPFAHTEELLAGYWMVQVKSKEEAIEWFMRSPFHGCEIELRQVFDAADFEPAISTDEGRATMQAEQDFRSRANG